MRFRERLDDLRMSWAMSLIAWALRRVCPSSRSLDLSEWAWQHAKADAVRLRRGLKHGPTV